MLVQGATGRRLRVLIVGGALAAAWPADTSQATRSSFTRRRPLVVSLDRRLAIFGTNIGHAGFWAGDLDRDGTGSREIVVAAGGTSYGRNEFWYVVSYQDGTHRQAWVGPWQFGVASLTVANIDGDRAREIVVGRAGEIQVWDGATRALERSFRTTALYPSSIVAADADGDGDKDLVFCDGMRGVTSLEVDTGAERMVRAGLGCLALAVGDVDGDGGAEIVVGKLADSGLVLDGASGEVEWTQPGGFGYRVRLGDLDGAGGMEIVATGVTSAIRIFSGAERRLVHSLPVMGFVSTLELADTNRDGRQEILFWDSFTRTLQAYDGLSYALLWSDVQAEVGGVAVADTDSDGAHELVLGTGASSTNAERLRILDATSRSLEWESHDVRGPFWGLSYGDLDGDGDVEVVHSTYSSDGAQRQGRYVVRDLRTGGVKILGSVREGPYWSPMWDLATADVDGDPPLEVLAASGRFGAGALTCYDGLTGNEQWRASVDSGLSIQSIHIADLDGDAALEVVVGTKREAPTTLQQVQVYVFDAVSGSLEWRSPDLGNDISLSLLQVAQLDDDPGLEIVAGARYTGEVFLLDALTHELKRLGRQDATALDTPDRDGDGRSELLVGTSRGDLRMIDPVSGAITQVVGRAAGPVLALETIDVDADGIADYVFTDSQRLHVQDGRTASVVWSSEILGGAVGGSGSLVVGDVDADGRLEIMVSNGGTSIDVFEVRPRLRR